MIGKCREVFEQKFGEGGEIHGYFSPGRVNLIGEHTDYNGGHVFPCALTIGTYGVARRRTDRKLRLYSMNFEQTGVVETSLDELEPCAETLWTRYVKGVIWAFARKGKPIETGFDFLCLGTIPNGSGLSSSASLEVLTGTVLKDLYGFEESMKEVALYSQLAENQYVGVNCGIMDQFAIAMGKKDHAIFLDTATLSYTYVPVKLDGARIVIGNTNKKRGLGDSKYNERRGECETALREIGSVKQAASLGALSEAEFEEVQTAIADPIRRRRARHAVTENQRTIQAVEALKRGDIEEFGQLMNASHLSLKEDYEVSCEELDILVEEAWEIEGVLGSRMMGAGFGGCTVSIVENNAVNEFISKIGQNYEKRTGLRAEFYVVETGNGATVL